MSKQTKYLLIIATIAIFAGFFVSKNYYSNDQKIEFKSLLVYPNMKTFTGFQLQSHNQKTITINDFSGKWTLLFFGFTHCPDVCPMTLTELQKVYKLLEHKTGQETTQMPEVLFVSVDPERDTPESLKEYTNFFNPSFKSATADAANILAITSQVGVAYHIQQHETGDVNYTVDHTAAVFLVNPDKQLYGIFRSPHNAQYIADDLTLLLGGKQ